MSNPKPKAKIKQKYLITDGYNDQEIIHAKDDTEAIKKALKLNGIKILKLKE